MRMFPRSILAMVLLTATLTASTPTVTLYRQVDPVTKRFDEGKGHFSFKRGLLQEMTHSSDWDLCFSCLSNEGRDDWFVVHYGPETRSVLKDLGEFNWDEPITIPVLQPQPLVEKGKQWKPAVSAGAKIDRVTPRKRGDAAEEN